MGYKLRVYKFEGVIYKTLSFCERMRIPIEVVEHYDTFWGYECFDITFETLVEWDKVSSYVKSL